tara:strand:- start:524 stop:925 length:402 start_codon:yes stop_codon:yes gene_type:complete
MNYILKIIILFSSLISCSNNLEPNETLLESNCNCTDLILDESYNHFFLDDRTLPFTGTCYQYFKNGKISISKQFQEGKMEGEMIRYNKNGTIKSVMNFQQNKINGKAIIYDSFGKDSIIIHYKNGKQVNKEVN